jgi:hypothetical protein
MDYPYSRKTRYNVSNNFWFLPTDLFATAQDNEQSSKTLRSSPILSYLDEISRKDKFTYILLILVIILFVYRINLNWTVWIGLFIGLFFVYYLNEQNAVQLNSDADQLWSILKGPLLNKTKYFITDPPFIRWVNDVSELKKNNVVGFNNTIMSLDRLLKLIYEIKLGVTQCKENLDLIHDLKVKALNQFHSMVYNLGKDMTAADIRVKYNHYFKQLGYLLNDRHANLIKICKLYYIMKPVDIETRFDVTSIDEPTANDHKYNGHYNYYN